ncbi:helix-turn-helix domain-containing protein [Virgibacillus sp. DJP39]|uniref:helix-turn-helix domain-containing protein n=1 Tax=Virgibacillus sp. DJP39 TaxID=3409790 RepID=UPI003BB6D08C
MLTEGIILKCSQHFDQNRTSSAIYHLIKGKKSIQTVQDAHSYHLTDFYGINRSLRKSEFDTIINKMVSDNLLQKNELMCCSITEKGNNWLERNKMVRLDKFNGLQFHNISSIFYERMIMLIQTLSNSLHNHYSFIPVSDKPQILEWVKRVFNQVKHDKASYSIQIYNELLRLLSDYSVEEATIYVDRLSGYKHYGRSKDQLAQGYHKDKIEISFIIERINHVILDKVYNEPHSFPTISSIVSDLQSRQFITNSASKTYELFQKGYSINEISHMRKLKENTIFDHIVEVALFSSTFPITSFVTEQQQQQIANAVKKKNTFKLKDIKQMVEQDISYFQIRLVLASIEQVGD